MQSTEDLNRTKRLRGNSSCLSPWAGTSVFLPSDLNWNSCSSWVSSLLALGLELTPSALLALGLLYLDWNYNIGSCGSLACWLQILGLLSCSKCTRQLLILYIFISYWILSGEPRLMQPSANSHVSVPSWKPQSSLQMTAAQADILTAASWEMLSQIPHLSYSQIPDPQKLHGVVNVLCFKLLSFVVICYTAIDDYHTRWFHFAAKLKENCFTLPSVKIMKYLLFRHSKRSWPLIYMVRGLSNV